MKTNTRFIMPICETAAKDDAIMPWTRGARRAAYIAKLNAAPLPLKKAA